MKLCNDTITICNARWNADKGDNEYQMTVIDGVSWFFTYAESIDPKGGLIMANKVIVRIPMTATVQDARQYIDPAQYDKPLPIVGTFKCDELPVGFDFGLFTLCGGATIVKGAVTGGDWTPAKLHAEYSQCITILGVTDNRRAPNAPHFKVVGA